MFLSLSLFPVSCSDTSLSLSLPPPCSVPPLLCLAGNPWHQPRPNFLKSFVMLGHVSGHNKWRESCGQVIWIISSICYLQLSINAALNGPCVSSLPATCQLLFSPPCWPPGRERGWGMRRAQSLWDTKHPSHLPPAFMPLQDRGKVRESYKERVKEGTENRRETLEKKRNESRPRIKW